MRGATHDSRFMAAIDVITQPDGQTREERLRYWSDWEFSNHPEPANVWVARIGGLYAGYLALQESSIHELRIQLRFDFEIIGSLLVARAGLVFPPEEVAPQDLAVA